MMRKAFPGNATVTAHHSRTQDLATITRQADMLIAAIERLHFVMVGINRVADSTHKNGYRLVGDVESETVPTKASQITPMLGGVGPMTVEMLMHNTFQACDRANR